MQRFDPRQIETARECGGRLARRISADLDHDFVGDVTQFAGRRHAGADTAERRAG